VRRRRLQVVDVVGLHWNLDAAGDGHRGLALVQAHQVLDGCDDVSPSVSVVEDVSPAGAQPQLLVDLVTTNAGQVVALLP